MIQPLRKKFNLDKQNVEMTIYVELIQARASINLFHYRPLAFRSEYY